MPRPGDRRPLIADHAIAVLARGGARALTHQAVDRSSGLAAGSTSYYFRTREALVEAAIERLRHHSRDAFDSVPIPDPLTAQTACAFIATHLHELVTARREQALAAVALLPEVAGKPEQRQQLMGCLFSRELATDLTRTLGCTPDADTADVLVDFLIGRLVTTLFLPGADVQDWQDTTQRSIERLLRSSIESS